MAILTGLPPSGLCAEIPKVLAPVGQCIAKECAGVNIDLTGLTTLLQNMCSKVPTGTEDTVTVTTTLTVPCSTTGTDVVGPKPTDVVSTTEGSDAPKPTDVSGSTGGGDHTETGGGGSVVVTTVVSTHVDATTTYTVPVVLTKTESGSGSGSEETATGTATESK